MISATSFAKNGSATLSIRRAKISDLEVLCGLGKQTFAETFADTNTPENLTAYLDEAFHPDRLAAELAEPNSYFFLAMVNQCPVGYCKVNLGPAQTEPMGSDWAELQRLYILGSAKGQGIGSRFLRVAEDLVSAQNISKIWLGVWEHNYKAQQFYGRHGYHRRSAHTFMVGDDPQTDLILEKHISIES